MEGGSSMDALTTAISTWGNQFKTDATSMLTTVAPIALGIVGLGMALMFGIKKFKEIYNKG